MTEFWGLLRQSPKFMLGILAAVTVIHGAGCNANRTAWVDIQELKAPRRPAIAARHGISGSNVLQSRASDPAKHNGATSIGKPASDEISRRIAEDRKGWEEYHTDASSQPQLRRSGATPTSAEENPAAEGKHTSRLVISPAVRRRHSAEYVNLQLRIAVLEARIASAGDSERKTDTLKLEKAKADLRAMETSCAEETQATANAEPSSEGAIVQPAVLK